MSLPKYLSTLELECWEGYKRAASFYPLADRATEEYLKHMPGKLLTKNTGKIIVTADRGKKPLSVWESGDGIMMLTAPFPFAKTHSFEQVLSFLHQTLRKVAGQRGWSVKALDEAYAASKKAPATPGEEPIGKPVRNPDRSRIAQMIYLSGPKRIEAFIVITDVAGIQLSKKRFFWCGPGYSKDNLDVQKWRLRWQSNKTVTVKR